MVARTACASLLRRRSDLSKNRECRADLVSGVLRGPCDAEATNAPAAVCRETWSAFFPLHDRVEHLDDFDAVETPSCLKAHCSSVAMLVSLHEYRTSRPPGLLPYQL